MHPEKVHELPWTPQLMTSHAFPSPSPLARAQHDQEKKGERGDNYGSNPDSVLKFVEMNVFPRNRRKGSIKNHQQGGVMA